MKPAKNNSLFRRHFVVTASMILLAFTILGAGFMYLSYRYTVQEKKQNLEEVGEYVSKLTEPDGWTGQTSSRMRITWPA